MINVKSIPKTRRRRAASICLAFFLIFKCSSPFSPHCSLTLSPMWICFPSMRLLMPLFPHFALWCDECFAYAYRVSGTSSNVKPTLAICFPFAVGTRTTACWHRMGSRVGFCPRLRGCVWKPVCVHVWAFSFMLHHSLAPLVISSGDACRCYTAVPPLRWLTHHLQSHPCQHRSHYCGSILFSHSMWLHEWENLSSLCK